MSIQPQINHAGRPTVCRSCGAIVGAGQSNCAVCGAAAAAAAARSGGARVVYDRETMRFARAVLNRPYLFTITFLIINFFVFLLMWHSSGMSARALWEFPPPVLYLYGAKLNAAISQQHQWWRFVTPMFIHVNLPHLLINMYSLWMVGPYVEKLYGSAKFVVFWIVTGIAGVVASYLTVVSPNSRLSALPFIFRTQDGLSAGASGALFGLVGVLFVFGIKFRRELPEGFKRAFGTGLLPVIVINLFIGYLARGYIDNAAHLGGLISGAALAMVVSYRRPGQRSGMAFTWQALQSAALLLVAVSFLEVSRHFRDPLPLAEEAAAPQATPADQDREYLGFKKAINDGQEALQNALSGDLTGVDPAIAALEGVAAPDFHTDNLKRQLESLLKQAKQLAPQPARSPNPKQSAPDQRTKLIADYRVWKAAYEQWLKQFGKQESVPGQV